jgi:hypothetical protein
MAHWCIQTRSTRDCGRAEVAELADATDLKSVRPHGLCGFDPRPRQFPSHPLRYAESVDVLAADGFLSPEATGSWMISGLCPSDLVASALPWFS